MPNPIIVCPYSPGHRAFEISPAVLAIMRIERSYPVQWVECHNPTDYAACIAGFWKQPGDLLIIEQDMEPTIDMVEDLLTCPSPCCGQAYWLAPASTGRTDVILAAFGADGQSLPIGGTKASYSAVGLCKLSESFRQRTVPIDLVPWKDVEGAINKRVSGQWHIHWPIVPHHHGFNRTVGRKVS